MAEQTQDKRARIPLKRFLADYKSGVPDREVMQKYDLSARSLISLIKTLMEKEILSPEDLAQRKQMTEQMELVKERQFLKGLFICPKCGHPHPQQFEVCPACEARLEDYAAPERVAEDVTTTGGYFYVDDTTTIVDQIDDLEDAGVSAQPEGTKLEASTELLSPPMPEPEPPAKTHASTPDKDQVHPAADRKIPAPTPEPDKASSDKTVDEAKDKGSPFKSVRALISKIRKT